MTEQERENIRLFDKWFPRLCIVAAFVYALGGWIRIAGWIFGVDL